jgi:peptide/nickel transport system substrate-binding protein
MGRKIACVMLLLVVLCTAATLSASSKKEAEVTKEKAISAKHGGKITVAYQSEPLQMDPHLAGSTMDLMISSIPHEFLWVQNKQRSGWKPMLATDWEWLDDYTLQITVREGVVYSDGRKFTAEDVKANIESLKDPARGATYASNYKNVERIEILDDHNLKIFFSAYTPGIFLSLSSDPIIDVNNINTLKSGENVVGLGAFILKRWDKGLRLLFERNPNYWDGDKPYVDQLEVVFIDDYPARKQALLAGDINIIHWAESADLDELERMEGVVVNKTGFLDVADYIAINTSRPIMKNKKIRQAIKYAVNKQECIDLFCKGYTEEISGPMYPSDPFYDIGWDWEQDVEKAKRLVKEVYPNGMKEPILISGSPIQKPLEELIQGQLEAVGMATELAIMDNSAYVDNLINKGDFDIGTVGDFFDIGNPMFFMEKYYRADSALAGITGHWFNEEVVKLMDEYLEPHTFEERKEITKRIYDIVTDEVPQVFFTVELKAGAYKDTIQDYYQNGREYVFYQDIWLKK